MGNQPKSQSLKVFQSPPKAAVTQLTARQLEVLALLCEGLQNKQIARRLNIAGATVKIHVANILRTLNVSTRLQAAVVAMSVGLEQQAEATLRASGEITQAVRHPTVLRLVPADNEEAGMPNMRSDWSLEAADWLKRPPDVGDYFLQAGNVGYDERAAGAPQQSLLDQRR